MGCPYLELVGRLPNLIWVYIPGFSRCLRPCARTVPVLGKAAFGASAAGVKLWPSVSQVCDWMLLVLCNPV